MTNGKNPNWCRIDILWCSIGVDGAAANRGGEVVVVVVVVSVVMVVVVGYWWGHTGSANGGDSLKRVAVVKIVGAL